jgi:hypothetical protein
LLIKNDEENLINQYLSENLQKKNI